MTGETDGIAQARLPNGATVRVRTMRPLAAGGAIDILVRPEAMWLEADAPSGANALRGIVERHRFLGNVTHVFVRAPWGQVILVELPGHAGAAQPGETVTVAWREDNAIAFPVQPA